MQDEEQSSSGVRVPPPLVYLAALGAGFLLQRWLPMPLAGSGTEVAPVRDAGYLLIASAIALAGWAVGTFRQIGTSLNPTKPTSALVISGPYRFTRNPMYLALALLHAGIAFAVNMLWPFVMLAPALLVIRYLVIDREESYMAARFGEAYRDYCRRVRRWL